MRKETHREENDASFAPQKTPNSGRGINNTFLIRRWKYRGPSGKTEVLHRKSNGQNIANKSLYNAYHQGVLALDSMLMYERRH